MKKLLISLVTMFVVLTSAAGAEPEYEKWGTLAVKETQKKYEADIIDYKHMGRIELSPKNAEEQFKLWLRNKEGREFGVYVFIRFDPSTEIVHSISFSETDR